MSEPIYNALSFDHYKIILKKWWKICSNYSICRQVEEIRLPNKATNAKEKVQEGWSAPRESQYGKEGFNQCNVV
jgi:ssDNA-binding Zn-finger/Zn-ribbon topoisomerase 1